MRRVALVGLLLAACTGRNPEWIPPGSDLAGVDFATATDARGGGGDLAGTTGADLAMAAGCLSGQRRCEANVVMACVNSTFAVERRCPAGSMCVDGACRAPPTMGGTTQGQTCMSESQCYVSPQTFDFACQPFVVPGEREPRVELRCARLLGQGSSGNACTNGTDCRSGFCLQDRKTCFRACWGDPDCPFRNNVKTQCRDVMFVVDGVPTRAKSCVLP